MTDAKGIGVDERIAYAEKLVVSSVTYDAVDPGSPRRQYEVPIVLHVSRVCDAIVVSDTILATRRPLGKSPESRSCGHRKIYACQSSCRGPANVSIVNNIILISIDRPDVFEAKIIYLCEVSKRFCRAARCAGEMPNSTLLWVVRCVEEPSDLLVCYLAKLHLSPLLWVPY
jgi:hypothetical protein